MGEKRAEEGYIQRTNEELSELYMVERITNFLRMRRLLGLDHLKRITSDKKETKEIQQEMNGECWKGFGNFEDSDLRVTNRK